MKLPNITVLRGVLEKLRKVLEEMRTNKGSQPKTDVEDFPIKVSFDIQLSWFKGKGEKKSMGIVGIYDPATREIKAIEIPLDLFVGSPTDSTIRKLIGKIDGIVKGILRAVEVKDEEIPYEGERKVDVVAKFESEEGYINSCENLIITYKFNDQNDIRKVRKYVNEWWEENDKLKIIKTFQNFVITLAGERKELPYVLLLKIDGVPLPALAKTINKKVNKILNQTLP